MFSQIVQRFSVIFLSEYGCIPLSLAREVWQVLILLRKFLRHFLFEVVISFEVSLRVF